MRGRSERAGSVAVVAGSTDPLAAGMRRRESRLQVLLPDQAPEVRGFGTNPTNQNRERVA
jgi:hypothetical protein